MKLHALLILFICLLATPARADILFDQMTSYSTTGMVVSCWFPPDGFDSDTYSYDNFRLASNSTITEVWWVGGNGYGPAYGSISGVTVRFYTGLASAPNSQPTITALPESETSADYLKGYSFSGNANETPIPGTSLFQYHVVLPTSLSLPGNTTFWIKIEGDSVNQFDGWGLAVAGQGIDSYHVDFVTGRHSFLPAPYSEAFQLRGTVVPGPPQLSQQPVSQTICAGANATFTVASSSPGSFTYQWRKASTNLVDDGRVTGSLTPTLQIAGVVGTDAAGYSCLVTNASGTTPSNSATLTVSGPPSITVQPSAQGGCIGATIVLNATATAAISPAIQWRRNGVPIAGAAYTPYSFFATTALAGTYDCVFTNSCGSATTNAVSVTVYNPMTITQQPAPATACPGGSASFTVLAASDTPASYTWRFNGVAIPLASNPTADSATLDINPVAAGSFGSYDCVVTGSCATLTSTLAALSPGTAPTITGSPAPAAVCQPGQAVFAVTVAGSGPLAYQWRRNNTPVVPIPGHIAGADATTLTITNADSSDAGSYDCIVTNICGSATSNPANLTINSADFNGDGDTGTDADIEAFFACLGGNCCALCGSADFNGDGDVGTDADIESFFRVLGGGPC